MKEKVRIRNMQKHLQCIYKSLNPVLAGNRIHISDAYHYETYGYRIVGNIEGEAQDLFTPEFIEHWTTYMKSEKARGLVDGG